MRKTKFIYSFVLFCIVLSFFSFAFAKADKITFLEGSERYETRKYSENSYTIESPGGSHRDSHFSCNLTGVYTISVTLDNGTPCEDYQIFVKGSYSGNDSKFANIAAYKDGEDYILFSPKTSSYDTTVKVYLYAGTDYTIANWRSEAIVEIYYSPSDNSPDLEIFDSGISSRYRTKKYANETYASAPVYKPLPDGVKLVEPEDSKNVGSMATDNLFEKYFVRLLLSVGDFFLKLLGDIIGSDVTITKIIFNGTSAENKIPALNPNLFDEANRSAISGIDLSTVISDWYNVFRSLAFLFYIITLLGIGIHILINSTGQGMAKAKSLVIEWSKGILLLVFMPTFIKYMFEINEAMVGMIYEKALGGTMTSSPGIHFTDGSEWSATTIEFRSPEYVSRYTGSVAMGSEEATIGYINELNNYRKSFDLLRICRAYAGATFRLGYAVIWYILIGQLIVFVVLYYKRFFTILFLIAAFPIICLFHAISLMRGMNKGPEIGNWLKKIIEQIFIQTTHAVVYALITAVVLSMFQKSIQGNNGGLNWLLMIVAINFVPEGEKILKNLIKSIGGSGSGLSEQGKGIKGAIGRVTGEARKLVGRPPKE